MDPISPIILIVSLVELTARVIEVGNTFRNISNITHDPRFIATQARLFTEQTRLALWTNYINGQGGFEVVLQYMEASQREAVLIFVQKVEILLKDAEDAFAAIDPRYKMRLERFSASMRWANFGNDKVHALIEAINSINTALAQVITPPPGYHGASHRSVEALSSQVSMPQDQTQPVRSPSLDTSQGSESDESPIFQTTFHVIQGLHEQTLRTLKKIQSYNSNRVFDILTVKLERWGQILEGPIALDTLLGAEENGETVYGDLKEAIIVVLVDIVLVEELARDTSRPDLKRVLLDTVACLASGDVIDIAANRNIEILEFVDVAELLQKGKEELECAIGDLYQLLPTIRMLRRGKMLDWEQDRDSSRTTEGADETHKLLDTVIEISSPILKSPSQTVAEGSIQSSAIQLASKEFELLREYQRDNAAKLGAEDRKVADELLGKFIRDNEASGEKRDMSEKDRLECKWKILGLVNDLPRPHAST
ncbi:hypothetical protein F5B20DRAFT_585353 [Whalleya microplaca]|nr:hypothetical protein F5B20DRAFT_585353 [Whalleya microplaca]